MMVAKKMTSAKFSLVCPCIPFEAVISYGHDAPLNSPLLQNECKGESLPTKF